METTVSKVTIKSSFSSLCQEDWSGQVICQSMCTLDKLPTVRATEVEGEKKKIMKLLLPGENSNCECQEQSAGPRTSWSQSPT